MIFLKKSCNIRLTQRWKAIIKGVKLEFQLPSKIENTIEAFNSLREVFVTYDKYGKYGKLDFKNVQFVDGNLAVLLLIISAYLDRPVDCDSFINVSPKVKELFLRNGLMKYITGENCEDPKNTTIDTWLYKNSENNDESKEELNMYIYSFLEHERINNLINGVLKEQINSSIFEVIENIFQHSGQSYVIMSGQFFPMKKLLKISIGNLGKTIVENVKEYKKIIDTKEAFNWALEYPHTTKDKSKTMGGIGIAILRKFLKDNHGKLSIVSDSVFYISEEKGEDTKLLDYKFPGTIVTLEINLNKELILEKDYQTIIMEELK